ncbi:hypothetical protein EV383_1746 [Pseudonocardia sediminis]|uniref:Polyketide cyclase/dehydrase/lipid transport protein n=1 Tax=Pseudonocardia sediminis TaxID=1397368 RepID=A0A4Q7UXM3_PSEST|nr:hypothetical protein [Pseudonocardia sediminis]RZT84889.1 hypothetical protein EV383_1746 [Pseudonocardia sediminis]
MLPSADLLGVRPRAAERAAALPGDDLVPDAEVVMDRAFSLPATQASVWPWIVQLGKGRSGWYLPRRVETVVPARRRGIRRIDPELQHLRPGDVIADWGGPDATFEVVVHEPPHVLVHRSARGRIRLSWAIVARAEGAGTRMHLRLRMAGIRRRRLAEVGGGVVDLLTIAGLAAGLRERVTLTG